MAVVVAISIAIAVTVVVLLVTVLGVVVRGLIGRRQGSVCSHRTRQANAQIRLA